MRDERSQHWEVLQRGKISGFSSVDGINKSLRIEELGCSLSMENVEKAWPKRSALLTQNGIFRP